MVKFERTTEMVEKMTMDSFGADVEMDLEIEIRYYSGNKYKAYSPKLKCYLQFPRKLRTPHKKFICDARTTRNDCRTYYSAYKGSIRDAETGEVLG